MSEKFRGIIFLNAFIVAVTVSTISNYNTTSFFLKVCSAMLMCILLYMDSRSKNLSPKDLAAICANAFRPVVILVVFTGLTLLYSANPAFGFQKWLSLMIGPVPLIFAFAYLFSMRTQESKTVLIYSLSGWGVIFTILIIVLNPFSFESVYAFNMRRWSHVIVGRLLAPGVLITFLYLSYRTERFKALYFSAVNIFIFCGLYLTGLRSAVLGILGMEMIIVVICVVLKKYGTLKFLIPILVISSILPIMLNPTRPDIRKRFENVETLDKPETTTDPSFLARYDIYKICCRKLTERPIFGAGFGGFRSPSGDDVTTWTKYPHNIILEFGVEFGVPGLLLLLFLLYRIFSRAAALPYPVILFFLFALYLALTSKDLPSQTLLLAGLGLPRKL